MLALAHGRTGRMLECRIGVDQPCVAADEMSLDSLDIHPVVLQRLCQEGSWEGYYYGDTRPADHDVVITKHRYSGFRATDLDMILRASGIRTIVVTGVSTNGCVESTARDSFMRDYHMVLVGDGTAAYSRKEHEATLKMMDRFFGEVTTIAELCARWAGPNA